MDDLISMIQEKFTDNLTKNRNIIPLRNQIDVQAGIRSYIRVP